MTIHACKALGWNRNKTATQKQPSRNVRLQLSLAIFLLCFGGSAWAAKDDLEVKVNQISPNINLITPVAQDVYSSSASLKVQYNHVGFSFPEGSNVPFGSFKLGLKLKDNSSAPGTNSNYSSPLSITIAQQGAGPHPLQLTPSPTTFSGITGPGILDDTTVSMATNCTLATPCPSNDGDELVANLQFSSGNQLNTSVKLQVVIKLVHPDPVACLKLYNLLTDQDLTASVTSTQVVTVKSGKNAGKVTSTTPYGQFSNNALVVNTCPETETFDLRISLDPSFDTNPNDNPGNAVFTYLGNSSIDPEAFNIADFSMKTPQGQLLCLNNIALEAGASLLATVHMGINRGVHASTLTPSPFSFTADLLQPAGPGCAGLTSATDSAEMTYEIK